MAIYNPLKEVIVDMELLIEVYAGLEDDDRFKPLLYSYLMRTFKELKR